MKRSLAETLDAAESAARESPAGPWWGYGLAVILTALALLVRWSMPQALSTAPFLAFYPAVVAAAALGGLGPGLLATGGAILCVELLFDSTRGWVAWNDPGAMARLALFAAGGAGISLIAGFTRAAGARGRRQAGQLAEAVRLLDLATVLVRNLDDRIIRWNAGCARLYGYTPEEALGRVSHELLRTRFPEPLETIRSALFEAGRWEGELVQTAADGRQVAVAAEWVLFRDAAGRAVAILEGQSDITARRRAEEGRASVAQFPEENPNPVLRLTRGGSLLYANHAALELLAAEGWQPDAPAPPALSELTDAAMRRGAAQEADLVCCDGRIFSFSCVPMRTKDYANLYGREVTETRRAEQQLRNSEQRYRSFVEASAQVVWTTNAVGEVDMEIPAWQAFTGQTAAEARGFGWIAAILPEHHERVSEAWRRAVASQGLYEVEYLLRRHDGAWRSILARGVPVFEADGRVREYIGTCIDITERKQAEEQLKQAKLEAEASNDAKGRFLANMSHEIRTPMNAILGLTALALEETLPPTVRDCLDTVKSSADNLLVLLNELLDLSRIESGKLQLEASVFRFRCTVEQILKSLLIQARQKGLVLHSQIADDVPDDLVGDPHRLRQVLVNLVGNAIKFTEKGQIGVRVSVEEAGAEQTRLRIEVADSGIGIAPADQARIFQPFTQVDSSLTRRFSGTGLGLAISFRLVELMGGRLGVTSTPGRGSVFHFVASFGRATASPCAPRENQARRELPPAERPLRILLAEDTPGNQKLITLLLGKRGHTVAVAGNGIEAVELAGRRCDFDLVLMDIQMPLMDGFEATAAIRALCNGQKPRLPIVAMTAHAMRGDRERCLAAGMDEYIAKPINARELVELIERIAKPS